MRVLYVNHTSRISGAELSLLGLLEALPADVEPLVACPPGQLAERVAAIGVEQREIRGTDGSLRLHPTRTPQALLEMGQAALQVRRAASAAGADLVHANSIRAGLVATAATRAGGRPLVAHVRDCLPEGRVPALTLRAISRADALIANSAYTRGTLGPGAARADVVHNAVDLARFDHAGLDRAQARIDLDLDEGEGPVLAMLAQITPWKGLDDAIAIAAGLASGHPGLRLLLAGSVKFDSAAGRYDNVAFLESLRVDVARRGLENVVRFVGERDDVPAFLSAVDLLLVPSWEEPFGRAVVEAMAAGVAVAATDVGGPPEILGEGRGGILLPPRRPERWVEAISPLLADPGALREMGARGREDARERFGIEHHVDAVLGVYRRLLSD